MEVESTQEIMDIVNSQSDKVKEDFHKYYEFLMDWIRRTKNEDVRNARLLALTAVMSHLADTQESQEH